MNSIIEKKISSVFDTKPSNFSRLEISIECPLDSGVRATGKWVGNESSIHAQFGGVKDFFLYITEYRKNNPNHLFNRILITAENSKIIDISFSFDEILHAKTMENIQ